MSESVKTKTLFNPNNHDKMNANTIFQPKPRKSLIVCQRNSIILSQSKKISNPEIVRPNLSNQAPNNPNQNELNSPASVKVCLSAPDISSLRRSSQCSTKKPLEPLSPVVQKKAHSKKIRSSYSVDTSWAPNISFTNNNEIRRSRFVNQIDDDCNDNNILLYDQHYATASDDQPFPPCNFKENV